ncbi:hypothetical protein C0J45_14653 [Silurus meridionalis]|nr:hypothetical protein C0J45_14653 [Silurus meridionalis]
MFFHSFPRTEEEEEAGEDEDEALKQEDEEKSVSGDPYVVVKLEDERDGGHEAERSAGSALEISLFAPLESSEDGDGEEEIPRPLTHTDTACWPCAPGIYIYIYIHTHTHTHTQCCVCACLFSQCASSACASIFLPAP